MSCYIHDRPGAEKKVNALPRVAAGPEEVGKIVLTADKARRRPKLGKGHPVRAETSPEDVHGCMRPKPS